MFSISDFDASSLAKGNKKKKTEPEASQLWSLFHRDK